MRPQPEAIKDGYRSCGKLADKAAIITGGDSGIGRAVAVAFAREGANVTIAYLREHRDARETAEMVEEAGGKCLLFSGDIGRAPFCRRVVVQTIKVLGRLDILVNNAAEQHSVKSLTDISREQLERTFRTNIFGQFYLTQAALPHLSAGSSIINTTSVTRDR